MKKSNIIREEFNMRKDAVTFGGNPVTLVGHEVRPGEEAPNFIAIKQDLSPFDFYNETGNKIKIISVAPSIDTSVCSLQTITFNKKAAELKEQVDIVTITVDLPFAQGRYCAAEGIDNIHVVSDHRNLNFGEQYGFVLAEFRLLARGIVVVDQENMVRYVEYVPEVTHEPNYDKALEEVKNLMK